MLSRLRGRVIEKNPPFLVLDVLGLGFLIQLPLNAFKKIDLHQELILYTKSLIKEEEMLLFGFLDKTELEIFEALISVPGLGPKSALALLSNFTPEEITKAIEEENLELLASVPRIGKKLGSKIILEMKGKLSFVKETGVFEQALNALCALGLNRNEAVARLKGLPNNLTVEELIKQALRGK